jgi:hypothetical protein
MYCPSKMLAIIIELNGNNKIKIISFSQGEGKKKIERYD